MHTGVHENTRYSCHILTKLVFSKHISEKYSNIKFNENPSSGSELFHAAGERADRYDEATSRFLQFCQRN
jgi:hypothetical protein